METISREIEKKRNCLERAKKILWTEADGSRLGGSDVKSQASIERLVNAYDELHQNISNSVDVQATSSSPIQKTSLELIYSEFRHLNLPTNGDRTENTNTINTIITTLTRMEAHTMV